MVSVEQNSNRKNKMFTATEFNEMINAAMNSDVREVNIIASNAGDNAADTVGYDNRFQANGNFTRAFAAAWIATVCEQLSGGEYHTEAALAFFAAYDIKP